MNVSHIKSEMVEYKPAPAFPANEGAPNALFMYSTTPAPGRSVFKARRSIRRTLTILRRAGCVAPTCILWRSVRLQAHVFSPDATIARKPRSQISELYGLFAFISKIHKMIVDVSQQDDSRQAVRGEGARDGDDGRATDESNINHVEKIMSKESGGVINLDVRDSKDDPRQPYRIMKRSIGHR